MYIIMNMIFQVDMVRTGQKCLTDIGKSSEKKRTAQWRFPQMGVPPNG